MSEIQSRIEQLAAEMAALQKQLVKEQSEKRQGAIDQIKALMHEHGLSVADLGGRTKAAKPRAASGDKRSAVAPKFRDPATGQTWAGRGQKPRWLAAAIAAGKKLEDFAI
ncbi:histone family protein nucleoid-structuring protein H-NS [beta proteobacterium AAP99]|nr:histone family protein nucleoid-structuring protein H-NS [beta proteobacterium AAP99]